MNQLQQTTSPEESRKFPVKTLLIAIALFAAAVAILVFRVPWTTVLYYGFFGLMLFSHFFMHGAHGGHNHGGSQQNDEHPHTSPNASQISAHNHVDGPAQPEDSAAKSDEKKDSHQGHSGCC